MGTGVGVATNVLLDVLALRKGNLAGMIENVIPDASNSKKSKTNTKRRKKIWS